MTILTKPFEEKKAENILIAPPVDNGSIAASAGDAEQGHEILLESNGPRRVVPSTFVVYLLAMTITFIGILSGIAIHRAFNRAHANNLRFRGFCGVPYDSNSVDNNAMVYINTKLRDDTLNNDLAISNSIKDELQKLFNESFNSEFFKEEFELDMDDVDNDNDGYTKITVPDFRDGRSGRFMHDFKKNQSCIIDVDARRCFVMPLDRETVLPPHSMYDLLQKMWSGFYNIDTSMVRKDMRVLLPAIKDMSTVTPRIAAECKNMKIYKLEKIENQIRKRSVDPVDPSGTYAAFGGRKIAAYDVVNLAELIEHENQLNQNQ